MARTKATLGEEPRLADYLSAGLLAKACPRETVDRVLDAHGKTSQRQRDLPAYAVVYYVMAMALYSGVAYGEVLRCVLEGLQFLRGPGKAVKIPGKSGISQARSRLSWEAMRDLALEVVGPIATQHSHGAWYRGLRLVSLDGTTLDVADERANVEAFGYPAVSRGQAACPKIRCVSLLENGSRVLFGAQMDAYSTSENTLALEAVKHLKGDMLCLADRGFFGYRLWRAAQRSGCQQLWRLKKSILKDREQTLDDGSYLTTVYADTKTRRAERDGLRVRVIEYRLDGASDETYRLVTTLLDPDAAPAEELAALYHERWQIETALDEFKTHLKGAHVALRSKTPNLVRQEFYGFVLTYFAVRQLIHEAALSVDERADELSFIHAVRVIKRKLPMAGAFSP